MSVCFEAVEERVDDILEKDWQEGEQRVISFANLFPNVTRIPNILLEATRKYSKLGWKVYNHDYHSLLFDAPEFACQPSKKSFWQKLLRLN